jgi:hypothetical protein
MDDAWRWEASCAEVGTEIFFEYHHHEGDRRAAVAVCRGCPVIQECWDSLIPEEAGLGRAEVHGIRAALTPYQRVKLLRRMCPGCKGQRDKRGERFCSACVPPKRASND